MQEHSYPTTEHAAVSSRLTGIGLLLLLFILLIIFIFVQIYLSRRQNKWYGYIIPLFTFCISVIMAIIIQTDYITMSLLFLILFNIPTAVYLIIYYACREKLKKNSQINMMNIKDLE